MILSFGLGTQIKIPGDKELYLCMTQVANNIVDKYRDKFRPTVYIHLDSLYIQIEEFDEIYQHLPSLLISLGIDLALWVKEYLKTDVYITDVPKDDIEALHIAERQSKAAKLLYEDEVKSITAQPSLFTSYSILPYDKLPNEYRQGIIRTSRDRAQELIPFA